MKKSLLSSNFAPRIMRRAPPPTYSRSRGGVLTGKKQILAAALAAAGLVVSACGTTGGESAPPPGGASKGCNLEFAFMGPLTGDYANLGINAVNGAKLALDEYNKQNADCQVALKEFDSQGDPEKATPLASEIVNDQKILGLA